MNEQKPRFPQSLRQLYELLAGDMTELNFRWDIYKHLYCGSPSRIELLNKSASAFFGTLQMVLSDDLILGITRLSDPACQHSFENQSLDKLAKELSALGHVDLAALLEHRSADIKSACSLFRTLRNKRITHKDLQLAVTLNAIVIPALSVSTFESAINSLNAFLNDVESHFDDLVFTGYDHVIQPYLSSVDGLIWALKKASALDLQVDPMDHWKIIEETEFRDA